MQDVFSPLAPGSVRAPRHPWMSVGTWLRVWGERRALERLDARMLADVGIDPADARREAERTLWDVPAGRLEF